MLGGGCVGCLARAVGELLGAGGGGAWRTPQELFGAWCAKVCWTLHVRPGLLGSWHGLSCALAIEYVPGCVGLCVGSLVRAGVCVVWRLAHAGGYVLGT